MPTGRRAIRARLEFHRSDGPLRPIEALRRNTGPHRPFAFCRDSLAIRRGENFALLARLARLKHADKERDLSHEAAQDQKVQQYYGPRFEDHHGSKRVATNRVPEPLGRAWVKSALTEKGAYSIDSIVGNQQ